MLWVLVADTLGSGAVNLTTVACSALVTAWLAWASLHIQALHRVRLDETGVWPNRKGFPTHVPWDGAQLAVRGYLLVVKNGDRKAEINMASFCQQRPLRDFLNGKFPGPSAHS
jgi:hypothetical protein